MKSGTGKGEFCGLRLLPVADMIITVLVKVQGQVVPLLRMESEEPDASTPSTDVDPGMEDGIADGFRKVNEASGTDDDEDEDESGTRRQVEGRHPRAKNPKTERLSGGKQILAETAND